MRGPIPSGAKPRPFPSAQGPMRLCLCSSTAALPKSRPAHAWGYAPKFMCNAADPAEKRVCRVQNSRGTWKRSPHLHQNPVWGDSASSVIDANQHSIPYFPLHVPAPCPQSFCASPVPLRAGSRAAAAFHKYRPTPGFSPGSHLPGLNFLSVITNVRKNKKSS